MAATMAALNPLTTAAELLIYVGAINVLIIFAMMFMNGSEYYKDFNLWTVGDGKWKGKARLLNRCEVSAVGMASNGYMSLEKEEIRGPYGECGQKSIIESDHNDRIDYLRV
ncbi:hypothetical protein RJ639_045229 [Escallonia herrerae]|uniref:Uncharacterized protein n=1 Tax=Escallonia herrerae TaxID=1293975 RepID=A0AA88W5R1_9ASTE|nr:hypothetical protein RJ639_045229 [Escallonia herrerae]